MALLKMILLIGLLIFVHELGHFLVAKMFKIKVEKFCFGLPFGPVLFEKKIGDVTYGVHLLFFLGGYVSFPDDNKDNGLPENSPELFKNRPIYQRACVLLAGVTANLITAYLLVIFCCLHWGNLPSGLYDVYVSDFHNAPKATLNSGLKVGDKLVSINGKEVEYPHEIYLVTSASKKFNNVVSQTHYEKVLNSVIENNKGLNPESILKVGQIVNLPITVEEDKVVLNNRDIFGLKTKTNNFELNEAQQKLRDKVFGKTKYKVENEIALKDLVFAISDTYSPIDIVVERDNKLIEIKTLYSGIEGKIGVIPSAKERQAKITGFGSAIKETQNYLWRNTKLMFWSLKLLVTGQVPMEKVTSVVAITKIGSDIIETSGMLKGLLLTAIISLNLAILNLMPIPALDGGHLMFLIIEKIMGKPVDEKVVETVSNVFFYILIALTLILIGNDIFSIWIKKIY